MFPSTPTDDSGRRSGRTLDRRARIALILLLLTAAALYLFTLDNGLAPGDLIGGDLITHQYAQVQARPSNAPGYPLYTMGGWLWFHGLRLLAPAANPVPLLSSYSTLWALLTLALLFLLLYRLSERNLVVSLGLSAFYAVTYFFWFYAVTTEQYTSAVFHTLVIIALAHAWEANPRDRTLYALAIALGLALAHMITVLFVGPGLLIFILWKRPSLLTRARLLIPSILLALTPLLSYAYVYLRGRAHPEWWGTGNWSSAWDWFISFLSTQQGQDELTWTLGPLTAEFPRLIWLELTPLLLVLGLAGWWLMGRRPALLYGLSALIYLIFCYIDRHGNWFQVIMPLYPLVLLGAGVSLDRLWRRYPAKPWRAAIGLILAILILYKFVDVYPAANQRNRAGDVGLVPGQILLAADPPQNAVILTGVDEQLALDYLTGIWGLRPDLRVISTRDAASALDAGSTLLVTASAAHYAAAETGLPLRYSSWGPELLLAIPDLLPSTPPPGLSPADKPLGEGLRLVGQRITPESEAGVWSVVLALRADEIPRNAAAIHDWAISVRPLAAGIELAQIDHPAPAQGFTPTSSLRPGEVVSDAFRFDLGPDVAPDAVRVILYRQRDGGFENLVEMELQNED